MGVTIHFEGKLNSEGSYSTLLESVRNFAARQGWPAEDLPEAERSLKRVRDDQNWDYVGLTKGLLVYPHDDCEPLSFEFDENFFIQQYCKTQFAGAKVHTAIVGLLRSLQPLFATLKVEDEGEYWDSSDEPTLVGHMESIDAQIARLVVEKPNCRVAVRLPSLRIVDVIY
ncbi:MAG: hypothetical protein RLO80_10085 [Hyphomonas sp.]